MISRVLSAWGAWADSSGLIQAEQAFAGAFCESKLTKNFDNRSVLSFDISNYVTFSNIGLLVGIAGTICVAFAFGKYPEGSSPNTFTRDQDTGKIVRRTYVAHFNHPMLFYFGLFLVVVGAGLQIRPAPLPETLPLGENIISSSVLENNLTQSLSPYQFAQNISALILQGASSAEIHEYLDLYQKAPDGNFLLKSIPKIQR